VDVPVIWPTVAGMLIFACGVPKFALFGKLKNSKRSDEFSRSVNMVFLKIALSQATRFGPKKALRAVFPNVNGCGTLKAAEWNHWLMDGSSGTTAPGFA
jgi:hypothetical protein